MYKVALALDSYEFMGKAALSVKSRLLAPLYSCYALCMAVRTPTLSPAELERRRKAARAAGTHLRLEGLTPSEVAQVLKARWADGEICKETWLAELRVLHNLSE